LPHSKEISMKLCLSLAAVLALSTPALVHAEPSKAACIADAKVVCKPEMATFNRSAVQACLAKNVDKISADCRAFMKANPAPKG